jgi:hypothetical protein
MTTRILLLTDGRHVIQVTGISDELSLSLVG